MWWYKLNWQEKNIIKVVGMCVYIQIPNDDDDVGSLDLAGAHAWTHYLKSSEEKWPGGRFPSRMHHV